MDIQTIRARLVNNLEAPMQHAMDHAKASTKEKKRTKHPVELSRLAGIFSATEHIPKSVQKTDSGLSAVRESIRTLNTHQTDARPTTRQSQLARQRS